MRPPEFTGGNPTPAGQARTDDRGFNEAAGIHRRKLAVVHIHSRAWQLGFNEAAGIHRRKRDVEAIYQDTDTGASMRPPEFTGGNMGAL